MRNILTLKKKQLRLKSGSYLIKPDEGLSFRSVNDDILYFSVTPELSQDVFLFDRVTESFAPNTLCGTGLGKGQLESCRVSNTAAVASLDGLAHADDVDKLHRGVAALLDVDLEDFAEAGELLVEVVGRNLPRQVPDVQRPRGLRVELVQVSVNRPEI